MEPPSNPPSFPNVVMGSFWGGFHFLDPLRGLGRRHLLLVKDLPTGRLCKGILCLLPQTPKPSTISMTLPGSVKS